MDMAEKEYTLFHSDSNRDIRLDYPELAKIKEFEKLNAKELRICWLIGSPTSPLAHEVISKRIKSALKNVYNEHYFESHPELKKFYEYKLPSDIPHKFHIAIERMKHFNLENRVRAKMLSQYMFDNMNQLVIVTDLELKSMEMDDKKKYAELMIKVSSELPKMIEILESGYGVKEVLKEEVSKLKTDINKLL